MNSKIVIAAVLMTAALTGIFSITMAAYAQGSTPSFGVQGVFGGIDEEQLESEIQKVQDRYEQARDDCLKILESTDRISEYRDVITSEYRQCIAAAHEAFVFAAQSIESIVGDAFVGCILIPDTYKCLG